MVVYSLICSGIDQQHGHASYLSSLTRHHIIQKGRQEDSLQNLSFSSLSSKGLAAWTDLQLAGPGGLCRFSGFLPEKIQAASSDLMPNCFSIEERTCRWTICIQWIISVITTAIAVWSSVSSRKPSSTPKKNKALVTSY